MTNILLLQNLTSLQKVLDEKLKQATLVTKDILMINLKTSIKNLTLVKENIYFVKMN